MGTWGPGLFDNDSAQDSLDELSALDQSSRAASVGRVLNTVAGDPATVMRVFVPEEIIVAAAVVAASLTVTEVYGWMAGENIRSVVIARNDAEGLKYVALRALSAVVDEAGGWWSSSWVSQEDRMHAELQLREMRARLSSPD